MGSYVERYWVSDATDMNKAGRLGGPSRSAGGDSGEPWHEKAGMTRAIARSHLPRDG